MATGTNTYAGRAVPLMGESEIKGQDPANDVLTITGAGSQAGKLFVCRDSAGVEKFSVAADGTIVSAGTVTANGTLLTGA